MLFLFSNKLVKNRKDEEALLIYSVYKSTIEYIKRCLTFLLFVLLLKVVELVSLLKIVRLALLLKIVRLISLLKVVRLVLSLKVVRFVSLLKVVGLISSKIKIKV